MKTEQAKKQQHWIYVPGGAEWLEKAHRWAERKTRQGKLYAVIEGGFASRPDARLAGVGNGDVLYVLSGGVREGRLGADGPSPEELAGHLQAEGLDHKHRSLKLFASRSGDSGSAPSFAEQVYEAMRAEYPELVVFGYRGEVDTEGFDGHKTAGLGEGETLDGMSREDWTGKGARAQENRVQFPAGTAAEQA